MWPKIIVPLDDDLIEQLERQSTALILACGSEVIREGRLFVITGLTYDVRPPFAVSVELTPTGIAL